MWERQSGPSRPPGRKDPDMNRSLERKFAVRFGRALPTVGVTGVAVHRSALRLPPSVLLLPGAPQLARRNPNRIVTVRLRGSDRSRDCQSAVSLRSPLRMTVRSQPV